MIYVVLGMHKSGTTLVSQILHHSGINMGDFDENVSYDKGNKYERQSCLSLDMDILGTEAFDVLDLAAPETLHMTDEHRSRMRAIIAECEANHDVWGFKDPRCALTYPLWDEELPEHRIIAVYRDPAQVWPRFRWDGKRKYHTNFNRAYEYLKRWHEHNRGILEYLRRCKHDSIMISYHELMSGDAEFQRLQEFVQQPLVDRRRLDLYRSRSAGDVFLNTAAWWLEKRTGQKAERTMQELAAYRS